MFARQGACVTSVDINYPRVRSTKPKFLLLGNFANHCNILQNDAENLPFPSNSFDIVYSDGVLHDIAETERAIDKIHRVLKPAGKSVIMLYCKDSWHYWFNMLLCEGILKGRIFKSKNWLGAATEWGGKNKKTVNNPFTRCYSR